MNINATLEKLSHMRLHGFERAYRNIVDNALQEKFTADELIAHLVDAEHDDKYNKKLNRLIKQANFEQLDFQQPRGLDKNNILRLQSGDWIVESRDILITGPTGIGKLFLACALGLQACINEYRTMYFTANKLFDQLILAKADGSYFKFIDTISRQKLFLLFHEKLSKESKKMLFKVCQIKKKVDSNSERLS